MMNKKYLLWSSFLWTASKQSRPCKFDSTKQYKQTTKTNFCEYVVCTYPPLLLGDPRTGTKYYNLLYLVPGINENTLFSGRDAQSPTPAPPIHLKYFYYQLSKVVHGHICSCVW